jgi:hypothetical protein
LIKILKSNKYSVSQIKLRIINISQFLSRSSVLKIIIIFQTLSNTLQSLTLPEHVGLPIGESDSTFFVMQVHFDNEPLKLGVVYNSSWEIFYTHQLKQFDASSFRLESSHGNSLIIPPNQNNFTAKVICYSECLSEVSQLIFNIGESYN